MKGFCRIFKNGVCIARGIERGDTFFKRLVGLMWRRSLAPSGGVYLEPCRSIHTYMMRFPIDALFLSADGYVIDIKKALPPRKIIPSVLGAVGTLELAAGTAERYGVSVGDRLTIAAASGKTGKADGENKTDTACQTDTENPGGTANPLKTVCPVNMSCLVNMSCPVNMACPVNMTNPINTAYPANIAIPVNMAYPVDMAYRADAIYPAYTAYYTDEEYPTDIKYQANVTNQGNRINKVNISRR